MRHYTSHFASGTSLSRRSLHKLFGFSLKLIQKVTIDNGQEGRKKGSCRAQPKECSQQARKASPPPAKKAVVAKAPPIKNEKAAPPIKIKKEEAKAAPPIKKEKDYFRGMFTGAKITTTAEPPLWSSELNGTWNVAYVESEPETGHATPESLELTFGPNATTGSIKTAVEGSYTYLQGELSMGALCEREFNDPSAPVKLVWSYGWQPASEVYNEWMDEYFIGPDGPGYDCDSEYSERHMEFLIDGPVGSDDYVGDKVNVVDRLPANCLWAHLHMLDGGMEEPRYDRIILCRPSDLRHVQQLLDKGQSRHFGHSEDVGVG
jgi:hypothetical protein